MHLLEVEHAGRYVVAPLVVAARALALDLPVAVHDGLEDGGEGGDADARADEDGVLGAEDVAGGGAEGTVHEDLQRLLEHGLLPRPLLERGQVLWPPAPAALAPAVVVEGADGANPAADL